MKIYNQAELATLKTAEIVDLHNLYAGWLDVKVVNKFRDKVTAIIRTLGLQDQVVDINNQKLAADLEAASAEESVVEEPVVEEPVVEEPVVEEPVVEEPVVEEPVKKAAAKSTKGNSKTDMTAEVEIAQARETREGSIGHLMFAHITANQDLGLTVQELVDFMVANYTKPRSDVAITKGFVVDTVRYFIRNGNIKLS